MFSTHTIRSVPDLAGAIRALQSAGLPGSDLSAHLQHFFYVSVVSDLCGLIGLEVHGRDALLRSLVVAPSSRGTGVGGALIQHLERDARTQGDASIYLLRRTAESFFKQRGYVTAERTSAIRAAREFAELFPAGPTFLVKTLADRTP